MEAQLYNKYFSDEETRGGSKVVELTKLEGKANTVSVLFFGLYTLIFSNSHSK